MSPRVNGLAEYLRARRAQLQPADVGFPGDPGRRVSGLKRAEVAELAGISLEYYTRLEQGRTYQLSEHVLANLANALRLEGDEAAYLYRLALPRPPVREGITQISDAVRILVDEWSDFPLSVSDRNHDFILVNDIAEAVFPLVTPGHNAVEAVFQVPASTRELPDWKTLARDTVAALRYHGDPSEPRFQEIVGALSVRDADFRSIWAEHEARPLRSGSVPVFIDGFGSGDFPWQSLAVPGGYFMVVYIGPPGSFVAEATEWLRNRIRLDVAG